MTPAAELLVRGGHVLVALAVVLGIGWLGRAAARRLRQPEVIGEIVAGLAAGPVAVAVLGTATFGNVLPGKVLDVLKLLAEVGLVLFLVGLAHKLRLGTGQPSRRKAGWVAVGGLVPALLTGVLFACWIILFEDQAVRGAAPLGAFLLMCAVALSITAVPVLARVLADRGITQTVAGRLAMTAAIVIDTVGWLLLSVAVGLSSGELTGFLQSLAVLAGGAIAALLVRYALRSRTATIVCGRMPRLAAVLLAIVALAVALTVERLGLTAIFGAVLVGLAVPVGEGTPWPKVVDTVTRAGRTLVPVFFVVTGITVLATGIGALPWTLIVVSILLAVLGKGVGGYAGARVAGEPRTTAARVGVLMNTRGMTELIVLKVGHSAGILTAPMFVALIVMAIVTTVMTGPLLELIDRRSAGTQPGVLVDPSGTRTQDGIA